MIVDLKLPLALALVLAAMPRADAVTDAVTEPSEDRRLSFTTPGGGKVEMVHVERGQAVKKDHVLMKLEAKEQEAQLEQFESRLKNADLEIEAAVKTVELARTEFEMNSELYLEKKAGSKFEYERAKIQHELRKIELLIAHQKKKDLQLELRKNQAAHARYFLRAPIDGLIEDVLVAEGETVQPNEDVVLLVVTDPLKIDAYVPTADALKLKPGDQAWVVSQLPGFARTMAGSIKSKATVGDAASETLRVEVEVANPGQLPAGTNVTVLFDEPESVVSAKPQAER